MSGNLLDDGPGATTKARLTLVVPAAVRRAGHGPITMGLEADGLRITEATLVWMVTTNKGWAHLRGSAGTGPGSATHPFRADLFAASLVPGTDDDRVALRVYEPGADPNVAGPTLKLLAVLPRGTIHLGA